MTGFVWVCLGAALGAPARYLLDRAVQARHDTVMPWGTMLVNIVGSFALGVLLGLSAGSALPDEVVLSAGTGLCGAFTTYSTFSYETLRLFEEDARLPATLNVVVSVLAGLGAAVCGYAIGSLA
jgi:fluoride exporter